jgi:hypothetical protein
VFLFVEQSMEIESVGMLRKEEEEKKWTLKQIRQNFTITKGSLFFPNNSDERVNSKEKTENFKKKMQAERNRLCSFPQYQILEKHVQKSHPLFSQFGAEKQ